MAMEITDANIAGLMAEGKPMILDFWATWCGPCQMIGPMIEELAEEFNGKIIIGKVNVDENSDLPVSTASATSQRSFSSRAVRW